MLPGTVHLLAVNPLCGERLLIQNNWECVEKSQSATGRPNGLATGE